MRYESLEKNLFKESFLLRRVIIPANEYIEWKKDSNTKQAYIFKEVNKKVLSLGGIFNRFRNKEGIWEEYFSIVTVTSWGSAVNIHHRMPLIVNGYVDIFLSKYIKKETCFKLSVLKYSQINKLSYRETAEHYGIKNTSTIANWQIIYDEKGFASLNGTIGRPKKTGEINMTKDKKPIPKMDKLTKLEREE